MNVLVTGGAGYIGSHTVRQLLHAGHMVVVVDSRAFQPRYWPFVGKAPYYWLSLSEQDEVERVLLDNDIEVVLHFAALAYVADSVRDPLGYYENNVAGTIALLRAMEGAEVKRLIFSSSCAVYGDPWSMPVLESEPSRPTSPYGRTKLICEQILEDIVAADPGFSYTALRFFNVAGAAADGTLGEDHNPEPHLIPRLLQAAIDGIEIEVYGTNYDTPDGTCIRDYTHVDDIARAHLLAMERMKPGEGRVYNLGTGRGHSVKQVIAAVERVTGKQLKVKYSPRRPGDAEALWANADRAREELGWEPEYKTLDSIIETAWRWARSRPTDR